MRTNLYWGILIPITFWVSLYALLSSPISQDKTISLKTTSFCRSWGDVLLGSATGDTTYDSCNLGSIMITETGALSTLVSDDYLLVFSDMCGDGEIVTNISTAPTNSGYAGLEVRESTASNAAKFSIFTRLTTQVQSYHRDTTGQSATLGNHFQPFHNWMKITRSGSTFAAYTSFDAVTWTFVKSVTLNVPNCISAGVYGQSLTNVQSTSVTFNSTSITDAGLPTTILNFVDSTINTSPGDTLQICVNLENPCICTPYQCRCRIDVW